MVDTTSKAVHILGGDSTEYVRSMEAAKRATDATVAAAEKLGVTQEKENRASRMRSDFIDREVRKADERLAAQARYEAKLAQIARAEQQGIGTAEQRAMLIERHTQTLRKDIAAIEAAEKAQKAKTVADRLDVATANQIIGGIDKHAKALTDLNQKLADVAKVRQAGTITLQEEMRLGNVAREQYRNQVAALNVQEVAMRKSATATGLARHEMINLSRQIQDVGVSLQAGQSPLTVLVQQGTQIADIFASSRATLREFFNSAIGWAGRFVTSTAGIVTGLAAIGIGAVAAALSWQSGQKDIERALIGIGQRSGVTVAEVNKMAEAASAATRLSTSGAREAAIEFINTGKIYGDNIQRAINLTDKFALAIGKDSTDAAKIFAGHLADVVKGAEALDKQFGFLDGKTQQLIRTLVSQGREQEAQALLMQKAGPAITKAAEATSFWAKAWMAVSKAAAEALEIIGKAAARGGQFEQQRVPMPEGRRRDVSPGRVAVEAQRGIGPTAENLAAIEKGIERSKALTDALHDVNQAAIDSRFDEWSKSADEAVRSMIPQIAQTETLTRALTDLTRARDEAAVSGRMGLADELGAAIQAVELQLRLTREAKEETQRQVAAVTELAAAYGDVSVKTSQALAAAQDQLNIEQALPGVARRMAQEKATIRQLILQGTAAEEAALIAAKQRLIVEAQIAMQHRLQVDALNDQLKVAQARTGQDRLRAQETATTNDLLRQGLSLEQASEQAALQRRIRQEEINRAVEEQTRSIRQQNELIEARMNNDEANVRAAQAYANAMRAGASATVAAANAAAVLEGELLKAEAAAQGIADAMTRGTSINQIGLGSAPVMGGLKSSGPLGLNDVFLQQSSQGALPGVGTILPAAGTIGGVFYKGQLMTYMEAYKAQTADRAAYDAAKRAQQQTTTSTSTSSGGGGTSGPSTRDIESAFENAVASQLLGGKTAAEVNAMIEAGQIGGGTPSARFQTQLDLYERAGMSQQQILQAIQSGVIGEGVEATELLAAIDRLTKAVNGNTSAIEVSLSPFYTSQGDRLLGYRGYSVQRGVQSTGGQILGTIGGGAVAGGGIMGGTINAWGGGSIVNYPTGGTAPAPTSQPGGPSYSGPYVYDPTQPRSFATYLPPGYTNTPSPYDINQPRYFAEGGVAERPTFGVFGEAGPEAFVPLKGGAIPVRFGGNVVLEMVSQMLQRMNVQAGGTKANVEINAPLVHFASEPTRDEVRESGYQAAQGLRRIIQAAA